MREIKFRGRKINTNKWVVGNLGYTKTSGGNSGILVDGKLHIVDSETVGQYTSLKDHNGNEIYEGDILYCGGWSGVPYLKPYAMPEKHAKGESFIVVKMDCGFVLRHISGFGTTSNTFYHTPNGIIKGWPIVKNYDFWNLQRSFEVIGNIYENQELLKGDEK